MTVPLPNLTFSTPSSASSSANFAPSFALGSGAGQSGINVIMLAVIGLAAFFILRKGG